MRSLSLVCILFLSGCMKQNSVLQQSSQTATEALGCVNMKSKVFDSMYEYLETTQTAPDFQTFKNVLFKKIDSLASNQKISDSKKIEQLKLEFANVFELLIVEAKDSKKALTLKEHVQSLIELEMQDQTTDVNIQMNSKLSAQFNKVNQLSQDLGVQCGQSSSSENNSVLSTTPSITVQARMIAGQNTVFATAYQSCQSLQIPDISDATPNVVGITRLAQNHPDGIGGKRIVSDLKAVQNTHPYIKVSSGPAKGCFDVHDHPLIYDYGGSPSVANNSINFFLNSGSGTNVLGVDCSAYVSSAIAAAGLRYSPGVDNKAVYARQGSSKFVNATASNFKCFQNISVTGTSSILPGDIAAIHGHVVMIDKVGADPFGIKAIPTLAQCSSIDLKNFDFTISQSSPSKNGMGINKFIAKDYLKNEGTMKTLFLEFAKATCQSAFKGTSLKPSSADWGIIRHKGTPECLAPRIQLANQSCVSQCIQ